MSTEFTFRSNPEISKSSFEQSSPGAYGHNPQHSILKKYVGLSSPMEELES